MTILIEVNKFSIYALNVPHFIIIFLWKKSIMSYKNYYMTQLCPYSSQNTQIFVNKIYMNKRKKYFFAAYFNSANEMW